MERGQPRLSRRNMAVSLRLTVACFLLACGYAADFEA
jgi:hypothetical protein